MISLLTYDAFSAHKTDTVESKLNENKSDALMIPAGCTSKCQLDYLDSPLGFRNPLQLLPVGVK